LIVSIGLLLSFLLGVGAGWVWFNLTTGAKLDGELRELRKSDPALRAKVKTQGDQIRDLTSQLTGLQNRQILESMGWRPMASESHPKEGEQILVAGLDTDTLGRAPNGSHYAQFKKLGASQVELAQGGNSVRVPLDGTVLWIPQRFLLK
jgi:hypothetical protein